MCFLVTEWTDILEQYFHIKYLTFIKHKRQYVILTHTVTVIYDFFKTGLDYT